MNQYQPEKFESWPSRPRSSVGVFVYLPNLSGLLDRASAHAPDILRHAGVDVAKKDFLGPPR